MTLTYGFYDSVSEDRKYNARQMGELFDGLILDGVYESLGNHFEVIENSGMNVLVGSGRAWFKSTWTYNDTSLSITVPTADALLSRIDIIYLEVNLDSGVRANDIDIMEGTPSSSPVPPTLTQSGNVWQYPLAHIYVGAGVTTIYNANITNKMGTVDCPFVTGPISGNIIDHDHSSGYGGPIVSAGITNGAVTEGKIAGNAVTPAKIPNRTRRIILPVHEETATSYGAPMTIEGWRFPGTGDGLYIYSYGLTPIDFVSGAYVNFYGYCSTASQQMGFYWDINHYAENQSRTQHTVSSNNTKTLSVANQIYEVASVSLPNLALGDLIRLNFHRDSADASGQDFILTNIILEYTADS